GKALLGEGFSILALAAADAHVLQSQTGRKHQVGCCAPAELEESADPLNTDGGEFFGADIIVAESEELLARITSVMQQRQPQEPAAENPRRQDFHIVFLLPFR